MSISAHVKYDTERLQLYISANKGKLNLHVNRALNMKPWPRLKTNAWPKKGVMAMFNNILICLYPKSVQLWYLADLQGWPTSRVLLPCP